MTFSIVARDPDTGDLGVAVASKFLAVGSVVPWARASVGAVATQAWANVSYGPRGLDLMAKGLEPAEVAERLIASDEARTERQFGLVDAAGRPVTYTGTNCLPWAGGLTSAGVAVQGNILAGAAVVEAMLAAFEAAEGPLPDRLLTALLAGDRAGGDRRGRQSAALFVARKGGGYGGENDRWLDLRVDDHHDPVPELIRTRGIARLLMERPDPADLLPIDDALAAELRTRLGGGRLVAGSRRCLRRPDARSRRGDVTDRHGADAASRLGCRLGRRPRRLDGRGEPRGTAGRRGVARSGGPGRVAHRDRRLIPTRLGG